VRDDVHTLGPQLVEQRHDFLQNDRQRVSLDIRRLVGLAEAAEVWRDRT
jgi:hypothetical protein